MTPEHPDRTRPLDSLSLLAGFDASVAVLPDGRSPTVVWLDPRGHLFIGDAKHADHRRSADTYLRLRRYACWGANFLARPGRWLVIALATLSTTAWHRVVIDLADGVGTGRTTRTSFGPTAVVEIAPLSVSNPSTGGRHANTCGILRGA
jgi:hypothetical protein